MQKQIHHARIIFLKEFTKQIILNSAREQQIKERIQIEKIKQRFIEPKISVEDAFKKIISSPLVKSIETSPQEYNVSIANPEQKRKLIINKPRMISPQQPIKQMTRPMLQQIIKKPMQEVVAMQKQKLQEIQPEPEPKPQGFYLGKLEPLSQDNSIQLIECSGPGKNILVRRYNQPNVTKIILNQAEITDIINNFSKEARIPIAGGILKAAVGNLIISAVISDFVGSRFIINKITPYSQVVGEQ